MSVSSGADVVPPTDAPSVEDDGHASRHSATDRKAKRPLSIREGTELKEEFVESRDGRTTALEWSEATRRFTQDMRDMDGATAVFEDGGGNTYESPVTTRFHQTEARDRYAELHEGERAFTAKVSDPHTVLLTFGTSARNEEGGFRAPADALDELLSPWRRGKGDSDTRPAYRALRRAFDGQESEYAMIVAPHESGYAHLHIGVWCDGRPDTDALQSVVDSHVSNCPSAREDEHPYEGTISVRKQSGDGRRRHANGGFETGLATYLGRNIIGIDDDAHSASEAEKQLATVLRATESRSFTTSSGFGERDMSATNNSDGEWELIGIRLDGELHEVGGGDENDDGGGSNMVAIDGESHSVDPVPWNEGG